MRGWLCAGLIAGMTLAGGERHAAATAAPECSVRALSAEETAAGADALNEALACLQRRIEVLEQGAAGPAGQGGETLFEGVRVRVERASLLDGNRVLVEFAVANDGEEGRTLILDDIASGIRPHGQADRLRLDVEGFAACGRYALNDGGMGSSAACAERTNDSHWTSLAPGGVQAFALVTDRLRQNPPPEAAAVVLRFLLREGGAWAMQDVSFPNQPLE